MNQQAKALDQLVKYIEANPAEKAAIAADPVQGIKAAAGAAGIGAIPDTAPYRAVIWFLGLTILAVVVGSLALVWLGKTPPDVIVAIGSAAVGALAGLLAPSPGQGGG